MISNPTLISIFPLQTSKTASKSLICFLTQKNHCKVTCTTTCSCIKEDYRDLIAGMCALCSVRHILTLISCSQWKWLRNGCGSCAYCSVHLSLFLFIFSQGSRIKHIKCNFFVQWWRTEWNQKCHYKNFFSFKVADPISSFDLLNMLGIYH